MVIQNAAYEKAMKSLWKDSCTVSIQQKTKDSATGLTSSEPVILFEDEPCLLDFDTVTSADGDEVARTAQTVTLLISSTVSVPAGSSVVVVRDGVTYRYKRSGLPAVYSYHQEVPLQAEGRYA